MQKRLLYIVLPFVVFFAYLGVRIPLRAMWESLRYVDEPISQRTSPRLNNMKRFLGAIVPLEQGDKTWFVKLVGSENEVEPLEEPFLKFVASMRFTDPNVPTWTLPEGWLEETPTEPLRYKTIHPGPKGKAPELTVSHLPGQPSLADNLQGNINRWRDQLGLAGLSLFELGGFYRKDKAGDQDIYLVDMLGPGAAAKAKGMGKGFGLAPFPTEKRPPAAKKRPAPFEYKAPAEWKEIPPNEFSVLAFLIADQNKKAVVTVSALAGDAGGLLANVNRWRKQVGLGEVNEATLLREAQDLKVAGDNAKLVDLQGPSGAEANRIVGVIAPRGNQTWFFKMTGPQELVGQHKKAFESFVKSVSFGG